MHEGAIKSAARNFALTMEVLKYLDFLGTRAAWPILGMEIAGGCLI